MSGAVAPSSGAAPVASGTISGCRACGSDRLLPVLSLGNTPLANALLTEAELAGPEPTYPLDLVFCEACSLVQITETVPPEQLFGEYLYFSSFSETMLRHAETIVGRLVAERGLGPDSLAVEVASNDGYLLQYYLRAGVPVLGVEPAGNIARVAEERGVRTVHDFFGAESAARLAGEGVRADVIHANNVLAHVADLNGVVQGFRALLKDTGTTCIEFPYVKDMIDGAEFDTIYHEHLCYFSLAALDRLFRRHDLVIWNVERLPIHGGSLRVFATPAGSAPEPTDAVRALLAEEQGWGVDRPDFYLGFAGRVERLKQELTSLVARLKGEGRSIAAYGASAKGSTLLNYFGIGRETLDFMVDRSTVKQGRYTPGTHLRIEAPEALRERRPDYVLLLTWNFADEILEQQAEYRRGGGRFIVPIPELRVV
ncbi:MAG TPA: class I SAM-dependent methyltransferase [Longimicrobium sp.]|uniref:class I SAM-dependent methyltransferase n=1 Tax=Longimicrobium sp. TaxID=2029185 RepID=UPI002ED9845C